MTPSSQSTQRVSQAKNGGACKTLPVINTGTPMTSASSRENPAHFNCGIRLSHGRASHSRGGGVQVFDVPGAIDPSNCAPSDLFNDCGTAGNAINAGGTIVGYYLGADDVIASFVRTARGKYTTFQAQTNQTTVAYDITQRRNERRGSTMTRRESLTRSYAAKTARSRRTMLPGPVRFRAIAFPRGPRPQ